MPIKQDPSSRKCKHELNSKEDDKADESIERKKIQDGSSYKRKNYR